MRRGSVPRSFTDPEASDLEKILQHCPVRKGSFHLGDMIHNMDLETNLPAESPIRRAPLRFKSEYEVVMDSKASDFDLSNLALANGLQIQVVFHESDGLCSVFR